MEVVVQDVPLANILAYALKQPQSDIEIWEKVVLDHNTIWPMMTNGRSAMARQGYGLYVGPEMVGYAVVDEANDSLDLMHIAASSRGLGLSKRLLNQLNIKNTCVDENNIVAINLYTQLGYEIDLIKDE